MAVEPLSTCHEFQAAEEQIEAVRRFGLCGVGVGIERPLGHWVADDI